MIILEL